MVEVLVLLKNNHNLRTYGYINVKILFPPLALVMLSIITFHQMDNFLTGGGGLKYYHFDKFDIPLIPCVI